MSTSRLISFYIGLTMTLVGCQSQPAPEIEPLNDQPIQLAWYEGLEWLQQRDPRIVRVEPSPWAKHLNVSLNHQDPIGLSGLIAAAAQTQGYHYTASQVLPMVKKYSKGKGKTGFAQLKLIFDALNIPVQAYQMYDPLMMVKKPIVGISITPSAYRTFHVIAVQPDQHVQAFFADGKTYIMPAEVFAHAYLNQPILLLTPRTPNH
jgi:hypothetical protein